MLKRVVVQGESMAPTIRAGQKRWVSTLAYRRRPPKVGDIVLVQHPHQDLRMLKRVAAVPGSLMNGQTLGPDEYFLVGDNPPQSTDSRHWGTVSRRLIRGRLLGRTTPK